MLDNVRKWCKYVHGEPCSVPSSPYLPCVCGVRQNARCLRPGKSGLLRVNHSPFKWELDYYFFLHYKGNFPVYNFICDFEINIVFFFLWKVTAGAETFYGSFQLLLWVWVTSEPCVLTLLPSFLPERKRAQRVQNGGWDSWDKSLAEESSCWATKEMFLL